MAIYLTTHSAPHTSLWNKYRNKANKEKYCDTFFSVNSVQKTLLFMHYLYVVEMNYRKLGAIQTFLERMEK